MSINLEDAGEDIEPVILMRKYEDIKDYKMHVETRWFPHVQWHVHLRVKVRRLDVDVE